MRLTQARGNTATSAPPKYKSSTRLYDVNASMLSYLRVETVLRAPVDDHDVLGLNVTVYDLL